MYSFFYLQPNTTLLQQLIKITTHSISLGLIVPLIFPVLLRTPNPELSAFELENCSHSSLRSISSSSLKNEETDEKNIGGKISKKQSMVYFFVQRDPHVLIYMWLICESLVWALWSANIQFSRLSLTDGTSVERGGPCNSTWRSYILIKCL